MERVLAARAEKNLTGKHALFADVTGKAVSRQEWLRLISRLCRLPGAGEHSLRRMGSQMLCRAGVRLEVVKFIGRWGSDAIHRYVEESLEDSAAWLGNQPQPALRLGELPTTPVEDGARMTDGGQSSMGGTRFSRGIEQRLVVLEGRLTDVSGLTHEAAMRALQQWSAEQREVPGAVVSSPVNDRCRRQIHLVDHASMTGWSGGYATVCGWSFGASPYMLTASQLATCKKCLAGRRRLEASGVQGAGLG